MLADTTAAKTPEEIDQHDHSETEEHDGRHDVGDTFQARIPDVVAPAHRLEHRPHAVRKVEPEGEEPNQVDHHVVPLREGVLNQRSAVLRREAERIFMVSQHLDQLHLRPEVEQMEQQTAEDDPPQRKHVFDAHCTPFSFTVTA